jgi:hypothetical protein
MGKYDIDKNNLAMYNSFANRAASNPLFGLGELLGQVWSKNYNNRGANKAIDAYMNMYGEDPNADEKSQALQQAQAASQANDYQTLGTSDPTQLRQAANDTGVSTPQGAALKSVSEVNNPANYQTGDEFDKYALKDIANKDNRINALQNLGYLPQSTEKAATNVLDDYTGGLRAKTDDKGNITGVTDVQGADQIAQQKAADRMANFDANKALAYMKLDMQKRGLNETQQSIVLNSIMSTLENTQNGINDVRSQALMTTLAKTDPSNPAYQVGVADLAKYNPGGANLFAGNVVSGKDKWAHGQKVNDTMLNFGLQQKAQKVKFAEALELAKTNYGYRLALQNAMQNGRLKEFLLGKRLGIYGGGGGGRASSNSTAKADNSELAEQYKIVCGITDGYEKKIAANPNYQATPDEQRAISWKKSYVENKLGWDKPDLDNYYSAGPFFRKIYKNGNYSKEEMSDAIRAKYPDGDPDYVNSVVDFATSDED